MPTATGRRAKAMKLFLKSLPPKRAEEPQLSAQCLSY